jgi:hypothetical protein
MRKLTYYVGATLDGFIADPAGDPSFLPIEPDVIEAMAAEHPWPPQTRRCRSSPTTRQDSSASSRVRRAWTSGSAEEASWPALWHVRSTS